LLASIVAAVLALAWFAPEHARSKRVWEFDARPLAELRARKPRYVLLGNSMLYTRIDPKLLEREIGQPVGFLARKGSASAVWYLMLKNYVADADLGACNVAIFFRETALTQPNLRLWRRSTLATLSREDDPTLEAVLADRGTSWQERTRRAALAWADPIVWRASFRNAVNHLALRRRPGIAGVDTTVHEIRRINELFALDDLRDDDGDEISGSGDPALFDFDARVEYSLLPHMLALANREGFKLWFIHVKRRPRGHGRPRVATPALEDYLQSLRAYVEGRNAGFIDLRETPHVTLAMYGRRDHIARKHRAAYTRMFPELAAAMFRGRTQP
jgi:hypothetical protein